MEPSKTPHLIHVQLCKKEFPLRPHKGLPCVALGVPVQLQVPEWKQRIAMHYYQGASLAP